MKQVFESVPINNPEVNRLLDNFLWMYEERDDIRKDVRQSSANADADWFTGDKYRDHIVKLDGKHDGFPEESRAWNLKPEQFIEGPDRNRERIANNFARYKECTTEIQHYFMTRNCALCLLYPPNGFIGWHNNANASAFNLIFSWSETGDGTFKYLDADTGDTVDMPDVKGWQCKAGYFASYDEPWCNRVYHAMKTNCWRLTVSFIFDRSDMSQGIHRDVIEEIMQK